MRATVMPEVIALSGSTYVIRLLGTAPLGEQTRGWIKQAGRWRAGSLVPGHDIEVAVRQDDPDDRPATAFEVELKRREDRPGKGPVLWSGKFIVTNTPQGPALEGAAGDPCTWCRK
jgi:hypothetical protein